MTEAGQIFALLRSSSAAELARRFNAVDGDSGQGARLTWSGATGPAAVGSALTAGQGGVGPGLAQAGSGSPGDAGPGQTAVPAPAGGATAAGSSSFLLSGFPSPVPMQEPFGTATSTTLRAWTSLDHLAPPRTDALRLMTDALVSGLARVPGASSGGALLAGLANEARHGATATGLAGQEADLVTLQPGKAVGGAAPALAPGVTTPPGAAGMGLPAATTPVSAAGPPGGGAAAGMVPGLTDTAVAMGDVAGPAAPLSAEGRATVAMSGGATSQVAVAEALVALMDTAGTGRGTSVASGVIFNAAMIPGWPYPSAFARDGAEALNPKALLHRLAAAIEGMSPEEAAEYMAKVGNSNIILRNLRRILKELEAIDDQEVKGFLSAFLETVSTIASSLQTAFAQLAASAALQAAVVHGEDPEDGDRPGRRRLRL